MGRTVDASCSVTVEVAQVADLPEYLPDVTALITERLASGDTSQDEKEDSDVGQGERTEREGEERRAKKELCSSAAAPSFSSSSSLDVIESMLVARPNGGTIVLKHVLRINTALPEVLLLAARLHHLCNELLGTANAQNNVSGATGSESEHASNVDEQRTSFVRAQVSTLAAKAASGGDLPANIELLALLDVMNIVNVRVGLMAEQSQEQREVSAEEKADEDGKEANTASRGNEEHNVEQLERMALIVENVMSEVHARMRKQVRRVLRKGVMPARAAPAVGELHLSLRQLDQGRPRVAKLCTLLMSRIESSVAATALSVTYMWLVGLLRHENAAACCLCSTVWPLSVSNDSIARNSRAPLLEKEQSTSHGGIRKEMNAAPLAGGGDNEKYGADAQEEDEEEGKRWDKTLSNDEGGRNVLLKVYREKMVMWGSWLISQWALFETISHVDISQFGRESVTIRNENSWSVPTKEALDIIATHGPLIEMGAGRGVWTELLLKRGVDTLAFDTLHWSDAYNDSGLHPNGTCLFESRLDVVKEGGPDILSSIENQTGVDGRTNTRCTRTLVLMWPDYMGQGSYALRCLDRYKGDKLILVGEWQGSTCGSYTTGVPLHGQSFSKEFQDRVESNFTRKMTLRLPTWPLFFDFLHVWERKSDACN